MNHPHLLPAIDLTNYIKDRLTMNSTELLQDIEKKFGLDPIWQLRDKLGLDKSTSGVQVVEYEQKFLKEAKNTPFWHKALNWLARVFAIAFADGQLTWSDVPAVLVEEVYRGTKK